MRSGLRKSLVTWLAAAASVVPVGCAGYGSPAPGYSISKERVPVTIKLTRGGGPFVPKSHQSASLALFGAGGIRYDLQPKGDGVFASSPGRPIPCGEHAVLLFVTTGRGTGVMTLARNLSVGAADNQHSLEVKPDLGR